MLSLYVSRPSFFRLAVVFHRYLYCLNSCSERGGDGFGRCDSGRLHGVKERWVLLELLFHSLGRLGDFLGLLSVRGLGDVADLCLSRLLSLVDNIVDLAGEERFHFVRCMFFEFKFFLLIPM